MDDLVTIVIPSKGEDPFYAAEVEAKAGCDVITVFNRGYGEAIKWGVRRARTKYILTMDADGQHTLEEAERLYAAFKIAGCDMMIGERRVKDRNIIRRSASLFFNVLASLFAGRWVVDLNSGMRIFRRDLANSYRPILCDGFNYTTSSCLAFLSDGYKVEWFPINSRS
jgi:glycosyltransferase involved in cell wall biosynthesis